MCLSYRDVIAGGFPNWGRWGGLLNRIMRTIAVSGLYWVPLFKTDQLLFLKEGKTILHGAVVDSSPLLKPCSTGQKDNPKESYLRMATDLPSPPPQTGRLMQQVDRLPKLGSPLKVFQSQTYGIPKWSAKVIL